MRIALLSLVLIGCVTTPYKPYGTDFWSGYGGYTDAKIGKDKFVVTYRGNNQMTHSRVQRFAYQRVNELCGDDFAVIDTDSRIETGSVPVYEVTVDCAKAASTLPQERERQLVDKDP